jgi:hypothetical protein
MSLVRDIYEMFGGTIPGWWVRPRDRHTEDDALRQFLTAHAPSTAGVRFQIRTHPVPRVILRGGEYELLYRIGTDDAVYLLNMDTPIANLPIDYWRKTVLDAAKSIGVEVLPLSETAYQSACREAGEVRPRLVARQGHEAVFTLTDGESERYYLSGYDKQENPPLYFLCELPHAVRSVGAARYSLQPPSVKAALQRGDMVDRQGDLFFISSSWSDKDIRDAGGTVDDQPYATPLYGTAHTASRVATLPNGVMLARGVVRHAPYLIGQHHRKPDHVDRTLKPGWWVVARNTVPASPGRPPESGQSVLSTFGEALTEIFAPFSNPFWALD